MSDAAAPAPAGLSGADELPRSPAPFLRRVVLVTGLSGAGKASILRVLEDLGYEAVDNPPLPLAEELIGRGDRSMALGIDTRSRGFDARDVLALLGRLRCNAGLRAELVFAHADETALLRRYTETRRRHPLATGSGVAEGVAAEAALTEPLRQEADLLIDTSDLKLPALRQMIEQRFSGSGAAAPNLTVSLLSFAFPAGLPREADLVFDARFLRNPHYDPILREQTGLEPEVADFVEADPDYFAFVAKVTDLLTMLLPRFVVEGKKYVSVAVGCTGGRHRSVLVVETLARRLREFGVGWQRGGAGAGQEQGDKPAGSSWRMTVTHRELRQLSSPPIRVSGAE